MSNKSASKKFSATIEGHRIELSNLDKVMYPETDTTKADVLRYYAQIAPWLIRHAQWRPATLKRWVDGVGTAQEPRAGFFQKDSAAAAPDWVRCFTVEHSRSTKHYPVVNDSATLAWLAQLAALEIHTPQWKFTEAGEHLAPDRLVIDLDPGEGVGLRECAEVAEIVRARFERDGRKIVPVTSGSKGIHLYVALDGALSSDEASQYAHEMAREIERDHPRQVVSSMAKKLRAGKVFIDWSQNNGAKTTVTPYSLRGRTRPTVAVPRTWEELADPALAHLEFEEVLERMDDPGVDPLAALYDEPDRLTKYRSMRDASRTPEPVPATVLDEEDRQTFVIQEHHARRLHFDFRLEHDGVLVSWALPKGVPTDPKRNHLAVHTEDHPIEYGTFEGTIPAGEYGGGTVRIWDQGTYELHKWRDDEVVATLHGRRDGGLGGSRTFALIHTKSDDRDGGNWLIHLMTGPPVERTKRIPYPPMLATATTSVPEETSGWSYEMKWDGVRAIAAVNGGTASLWSRNGNILTESFPEIAHSLPDAVKARDIVLDGEIVALDERGRPNFGRLQDRLGVLGQQARSRAASIPAHLMVFDILRADGREFTTYTYRERRELLERFVTEATNVVVPPNFDTDLKAALHISEEHGLEGVLAKRNDSLYTPGKRTRSWLKVKHRRTQEVVIVGWVESKAGGLGSMALAVPEHDELRYVGKVGTGWNERERRELLDTLSKASIASPVASGIPTSVMKQAHWVKPRYVGEVAFTEMTRSGTLRHPVWRGMRLDKSPEDVVLESV